IQTITDQLQYKLNDKNILIINTVSATPGLSLPISAQKLYFILLNLLTNAIKFSPDNQNIEIYAKSNGIYVRDHGKGIDPETMNNLGKKDIDKNETDGGSGMGIMLVSNLLAGSKVKLRFENAKGGGTVAGVVLV
nr:sensor histidine kinase [Saprospiraceae bacterium]